jgi:NAD(P)-dependent dehydrogenase (short-subunit alcohol dehydrogenase family)
VSCNADEPDRPEGASIGTRSFALDGKVIAITGGAGRLGRILAGAFAADGARVAILDQAPLPAPPPDGVVAFPCDVTDRASVAAALTGIEAMWGTPHGLVTAAAIDSPPDAPSEENGPFETYPVASWDRIMSANVKGVFLCAQVIGGAMARGGRGSIVNIGSIYGLVSPDQGLYRYRRDRGETFFKPVAYSASKSALYNLTRYLATYWAAAGVRVNTLTLGGIWNEQEPAFLEAYCAKVPLGRMATGEDYVGAVQFMLSDASRYMTGANLVVDGGFTAW